MYAKFMQIEPQVCCTLLPLLKTLCLRSTYLVHLASYVITYSVLHFIMCLFYLIFVRETRPFLMIISLNSAFFSFAREKGRGPGSYGLWNLFHSGLTFTLFSILVTRECHKPDKILAPIFKYMLIY